MRDSRNHQAPAQAHGPQLTRPHALIRRRARDTQHPRRFAHRQRQRFRLSHPPLPARHWQGDGRLATALRRTARADDRNEARGSGQESEHHREERDRLDGVCRWSVLVSRGHPERLSDHPRRVPQANPSCWPSCSPSPSPVVFDEGRRRSLRQEGRDGGRKGAIRLDHVAGVVLCRNRRVVTGTHGHLRG